MIYFLSAAWDGQMTLRDTEADLLELVIENNYRTADNTYKCSQ